MIKQMCWLSKFGSNGALVLHLRLDSHKPWRPYTFFPEIAVPDYPIPGGSKGWATSQKLLKAGWKLIPTAQAKNSSVNPPLAA